MCEKISCFLTHDGLHVFHGSLLHHPVSVHGDHHMRHTAVELVRNRHHSRHTATAATATTITNATATTTCANATAGSTTVTAIAVNTEDIVIASTTGGKLRYKLLPSTHLIVMKSGLKDYDRPPTALYVGQLRCIGFRFVSMVICGRRDADFAAVTVHSGSDRLIH
jgi:hypothetical protein